MNELTCPKCDGVMETGHILDRTEQNTMGRDLRWVAGEQNHGPFGGLIFSGKRLITITAYRCTACGYLELYARGERKKKG